jgi:hypothetical protein
MKTGTSTLMNNTPNDYLNKDDYHNKKETISYPMDKPEEIYTAIPEKNITVCHNFVVTPDYVGCYALGGGVGLKIYFGKKPKWLHRKMMKLCLGWEWIDN